VNDDDNNDNNNDVDDYSKATFYQVKIELCSQNGSTILKPLLCERTIIGKTVFFLISITSYSVLPLQSLNAVTSCCCRRLRFALKTAY